MVAAGAELDQNYHVVSPHSFTYYQYFLSLASFGYVNAPTHRRTAENNFVLFSCDLLSLLVVIRLCHGSLAYASLSDHFAQVLFL